MSDVKHYANLVKLNAQMSSTGAFKSLSDQQFIVEYANYSECFLIMVGEGTRAESIGDWSGLDKKPTHIIIYYKNPPMIMKVDVGTARKHLKNNNGTYTLDLSSIKPYLSENKDCLEKFDFENINE